MNAYETALHRISNGQATDRDALVIRKLVDRLAYHQDFCIHCGLMRMSGHVDNCPALEVG